MAEVGTMEQESSHIPKSQELSLPELREGIFAKDNPEVFEEHSKAVVGPVLRVSPNPLPFGGTLTIDYFAERREVHLRVYRVTGQVTIAIDPDRMEMGWNKLLLPLGHLSAGTYIVSDNYGNYKKFVVIE